MKQISIALLFLLIYSTGKSQSCKDLPTKFSSYRQAVNSIKGSKFILTDQLPDGKSSWIKSANYYSCDGYNGYLIYRTEKGKEYIHEKVPISVWKGFKTANSSGSYYVHNIKGKYRLVPE